MLFASLSCLEELKEVSFPVDGVELRLDLFSKMDRDALKELRMPNLLFTLRTAGHGGQFLGTRQEQEALIQELLNYKPSFFDLECDMDGEFLTHTINGHQDIQFILSYHQSQNTPLNLENLYQKMSVYPAYRYKIAFFPRSTNEALQALLFERRYPKVSVICLGEKGSFARLIKPSLLYAYVNQSTAPGQVSLEDLFLIYNYPNWSEKTAFYGLIGDPVHHSQGHLYHNQVFKEKQWNAIYVKMQVTKEELPEFLSLAKLIGFTGLSVTSPLKQIILSFIDRLDPAALSIGAVNTLFFEENTIVGTNTDGLGAIKALEKTGPLLGKKILLFGAGGAARAIAYEAVKRGAHVFVTSRTWRKTKELASCLSCAALEDNKTPEDCDIWINCTPSMPTSFTPPSHATVMDIVYNPRKTPFLIEAEKQGCILITGDEMFLNQASLQSFFWHHLSHSLETV